VTAALLALLPALATDPGPSAAVARNVIGLTGLALLVRHHVGAAGASATAAAHLALAALLGARPQGEAAWWAYPVAEAVDPWGAGVAVALLLLGLTVTVRPRDQQPARLRARR
jgi:hypothetical protein